MSKLFIADTLSSIQSQLSNEKGNWLCIVDNIDIDISAQFQNKVKSVRETEIEMIEKSDFGTELDAQIIKWLKLWANKPVMKNKSIKQVLQFENTSLWWFGESILFRQSMGNYPSLKMAITRIEAIKYQIEISKPKMVKIENSNSITGKSAFLISKSQKIKCQTTKPDLNSIDDKYLLKAIALKVSRSLIRSTLSKIHGGKYQNTGQKKDIMVFSYFHQLKFNEKRGIKEDVILQPVFDALDKTYNDEYRIMYYDFAIPLGMDSIRNLNAPAYPFDYYSPISCLGELKNYRKFKRLWDKLSKSKQFRESMIYKNIDVWPIMKEYFAFLFLKQYPEAIKCMKTVTKALETEKPQILIIHNETGFYGKALSIAARKRRIKTIGIQHGGFGKSEIEYMHEFDGEILSCPVPDITAVWGENDRAEIVSHHPYNEANVKVTGSPRYDILSKADEMYDRQRFFDNNKINKKWLVAITTQPFPDMRKRKDWLDNVIGAIKEIPDTHFIIKPHPYENTSYHEQLIKETGSSNIELRKDIETTELLYCADLSITAWSTTGLESIIFGTPLITHILPGQEETMPYSKMGAAIGTSRGDEIAPAIIQILGKELSPELKQGMDEFIRAYAYKIDGKASKRILDLIDELLAK